MSSIDFDGAIESRRALELNAHHIPQNEYEKLDKAFEVDAEYSFLSAFYSRGVILFLFNKDDDNEQVLNFQKDFPVLFTIAKCAMAQGVYFLDLDEEGSDVPNLKIFEWSHDEPLTPYGDLPEGYNFDKTLKEIYDVEVQEDEEIEKEVEEKEIEVDNREEKLRRIRAILTRREEEEPQLPDRDDVMDWVAKMTEYIEREKRRQNDRFA